MRSRLFVLVFSSSALAAIGAAPAAALVTPGWECIPTTAGQAVVSGGTASTPACAAGTTAVLAPTFVSSGVGGKPTVEFSAVNVQVINGSGAETTVNGTGNLILGYDEKPGAQTGSHNLLLGGSNSYTSYGGIVAGLSNSIANAYASVLGGSANKASGSEGAIVGGYANRVASSFATILGGCSNLSGAGTVSVNPICTRPSEHPSGFVSILGGTGNQAGVTAAAVLGGLENDASGVNASILGGKGNKAVANCQAIPVAPGSC